MRKDIEKIRYRKEGENERAIQAMSNISNKWARFYYYNFLFESS